MTSRLGLAVVSACLAAASPVQSQESTDSVRIAILVDGEWGLGFDIANTLTGEMDAILRPEFAPVYQVFRGDWTYARAEWLVDSLSRDPATDLLVGAGILSSHRMAVVNDRPIPVVAAAILDPAAQGLAPTGDGRSGVANLSYVSYPTPFVRDLQVFRSVVDFDNLAFLIQDELLQVLPAFQNRLGGMSGVQLVPVGRDGLEAAVSLRDNIDAVYLSPLMHLSDLEFRRMTEALARNGIASFSALGRIDVERGVLIGLNPPDFFERISRRIALNVQSILIGVPAESLPVAFAPGERMVLNMATARDLEFSPSWEVLTEAELLNREDPTAGRQLDLVDAAREALNANFDLLAAREGVAAGENQVAIARANLLPNASAFAAGLIIDDDRAAASLGAQAERSMTAGLSLSQIIFSEPALAGVSIQNSLQAGRKQELRSLELDIQLEALLSFLNLLRAEEVLEVRRNNVRVTRRNLELARVRQTIGSAGPGEVLRWESELASRRREALSSQAERELARTQLNRLLQRPLEEEVRPAPVTISDPRLMTGNPRTLDYTGDPASYRRFRDFLTSEGLETSPELATLDALIDAKQRELGSNRRSVWLPQIGIEGQLTNLFAEGGAGAGSPQLPPQFAGAFPTADDLNWSIALQASIPIFQGGARYSRSARASRELEQLRLTRAAASQKIEQRIRSELHQISSTFPAIGLAQEAARAARANLDVVTDAYSQGVVSITELLDAQNAALTADVLAANAEYEFLIDLMQVERAMGQYYFSRTPESQRGLFQRLEQYFQQ